MRTKHLATAAILCSSTLLLTACGGSDSDNDTYNGGGNQSNVDYSKAETSDLMTHPVVSLVKEMDNTLIRAANMADEIHYDVTDPDNEGWQTSCESGTVKKNSNNTVTLDNCKNFKIRGEIAYGMDGLTLSGTINTVETAVSNKSTSPSIDKYEIVLTNFTIKNSDGEVETYTGKMLQTFTYDQSVNKHTSLYEVSQMDVTWADQTDKEHYIVTNYYVTETNDTSNSTSSPVTPATANGTLQGDVNGQKFSVKFDSNIEYKWGTFAPTKATINIEDTNNSKNTITINNTTDGKALISAFANGSSVTGYPKTVNWAYFE